MVAGNHEPMDAAALASLAGFVCERTAATAAELREATAARSEERAWRARDAETEVLTLRERAPERAEAGARAAWRGAAAWVSAARAAVGAGQGGADGIAAGLSRAGIGDGAVDDALGTLRMVRRRRAALPRAARTVPRRAR